MIRLILFVFGSFLVGAALGIATGVLTMPADTPPVEAASMWEV